MAVGAEHKTAKKGLGNQQHGGSCHCGAVQFSAEQAADIWFCHCHQCQKLTGHFVAAAGVMRDNFSQSGDVTWRAISPRTKTGSCSLCGSLLFWDSEENETISIMAGSFDDASGLAVKGHIFVGEKNTYYDITDGLPQFESYPPGDMLRGVTA